MAKRPIELWAFWAGAFGPVYKRPQRAAWHATTKLWWSKDENEEVRKVGLDDEREWVVFAHPDKQRVQDFIAGYNAARSMMRKCLDFEGD